MTCGTPSQRTCSLTERRSPTSPRSSATVSRRPRRPFYAHWIPRGDKTYIDRLAAARLTVAPKAPPTPPDDVLTSESRHRSGTISTGVDMNDAELLETSGAGGGSRTRDLLITNQMLCL